MKLKLSIYIFIFHRDLRLFLSYGTKIKKIIGFHDAELNYLTKNYLCFIFLFHVLKNFNKDSGLLWNFGRSFSYSLYKERASKPL